MPSPTRIHQPYGLDLPGFPVSVHSFTGEEALNEPYRFVVDVTSAAVGAALGSLIGRRATFRIRSVDPGREALVARYGDLASLAEGPPRSFAGVVTGIEDVGEHGDEIRYRIVLEARLAQLAGHVTSRLFQHASVPEIIEAVLRHAGFAGHDFRFDLKDAYARREYTTQYAESSLAFVQRLAADEGLWFRFEQGAQGEVVVFGDHDGARGRHEANLPYRRDAGLESVGDEAVTRLGVRHRSVPGAVRVDDYNHRTAEVALLATDGDAAGIHLDHRWGTHHASPQAGERLARLRHEAHLCTQTVYEGEGNAMTLGAGDVVRVPDAPYAEAAGGLFVTGIAHEGARDRAYRHRFHAIPAERAYRPLADPATRPRIAGVLPARVVTAGMDTYAPLDGEGWYRVRLPFDLDTWSPGGSSRPVRFARPYAGAGYGHHFPLLAGTEVALVFTDGDPDRPIIVGALHDSQHTDPVRAPNRTRNIVRSAAGNELRFEDQREGRHVHLHTPHATSELNLGHMVDSGGATRGDGAELRTDGHASLRGKRGVLVSAGNDGAVGEPQLAMEAARHRIESALSHTRTLSEAGEAAQTAALDVARQERLLRERLDRLQAAVVLVDAAQGLALGSGDDIQLVAEGNIAAMAARNLEVAASDSVSIAARGGLSLFAQELGIAIVAAMKDVRLEARTGALSLAADRDINMASTSGGLMLTSREGITLASGGAYIRLRDGRIEIACPGEMNLDSGILKWSEGKSLNVPLPAMQVGACEDCLLGAGKAVEPHSEVF
ncbi:type VI secretion system Vgr family protein [Luteibacter sp.]|jgi:type VI secretion system secreted protein VgrG|uniref:type VI secretion system Vgr family protein n=1 Tax=Luteibacter sp. TaxID=1886636 RepID=UPI002F3FB496